MSRLEQLLTQGPMKPLEKYTALTSSCYSEKIVAALVRITSKDIATWENIHKSIRIIVEDKLCLT